MGFIHPSSYKVNPQHRKNIIHTEATVKKSDKQNIRSGAWTYIRIQENFKARI